MLFEICFARGGIFGPRSWDVIEAVNENEVRTKFLLEHPNDVVIDIELC